MPRRDVSRSWKRRAGFVSSSRRMRIVQRSPTMSSVRATGHGSVLFGRVTILTIATQPSIVNGRLLLEARAELVHQHLPRRGSRALLQVRRPPAVSGREADEVDAHL